MFNFPDLVVQSFFGFFVLGSGIWFGWNRFVRPYTWLDRKGQVTLFLLLLTLFGGGIGGIGWFSDDPRSFAWDLPPLASRMLGAAGWAFALLSFRALQRLTWAGISLVLLAIVVYLIPIALFVVTTHLERFDFTNPITYGFFFVTLGMALAALWLLIAPSAALQQLELRNTTSIARWVRICLILTSCICLPWALALAVTDQGSSPLIWAWRGDLLTSRLIAAMLFTIGITSLYSLRSLERTTLTLLTNSMYGLGVFAAGLINLWTGKPLPIAYVVAFGLIALISILALVAIRNPSKLSQ